MPTPAAIGLHIVQIPWSATVFNTLCFNPPKDGVEIFIGHMKGVVMAFKPFPVIKIQGQAVVYLYRGEVPSGAFVSEAKDICEPSSTG